MASTFRLSKDIPGEDDGGDSTTSETDDDECRNVASTSILTDSEIEEDISTDSETIQVPSPTPTVKPLPKRLTTDASKASKGSGVLKRISYSERPPKHSQEYGRKDVRSQKQKRRPLQLPDAMAMGKNRSPSTSTDSRGVRPPLAIRKTRSSFIHSPTTVQSPTQVTQMSGGLSPRCKTAWSPIKESKQVIVEYVPGFQVCRNIENLSATADKVAHIVRSDGKKSTRTLKDEPFFHGLLPREQIGRKLRKDGDYLVRETDVGQEKRFTITVLWKEQMKHFLIEVTPKGYFHVGEHTFQSVTDLLSWYRQSRRPLSKESGVILKKAVKRGAWQLSHDQIKVGRMLGEGAFGQVHRAQLVHKDRLYNVAVKILHKSFACNRNERLIFLEEFRMMRRLSHPNIVQVFGVAAQQEPLMIIMEYMALGSLLSYLRRQHHGMTLVDRVRFICAASDGMRYLEKMGVTHRDIATRNCLLGRNREIKIADFGLSRAEAIFRDAHRMKMPIKWLAAPETLTRSQFSIKSDVWSFGILIWEVFADGRDPYPGMTNHTVRAVLLKQRYRMPAPLGTPDPIRRIMQLCWQEEPINRPSFNYINRCFTNMLKNAK